MNILIIAGSPRKGGNTDLLVDAFVSGAAQNNRVEVVQVRDYKINPCIGCDFCKRDEENACCQADDMSVIYSKMATADMLVWASPVYFYGVSAQLKALIDRLHNPIRSTFKIKKIALLLVAADTIPELFYSILTQYRLCLSHFHLEDAGQVLVGGVREKGAISENEALQKAVALGENIINETCHF